LYLLHTMHRCNVKLLYVDASADGQVRRVAERFALIALAGELAIEAGIVPYATGEATLAAGICFKAWVLHRGGQGAHEKAQALQQVRHFLELHQASRFQHVAQDGEGETTHKTINLAGYIKQAKGERYFLIQPEVFKADVCSGLDYSFVCTVLHQEGHLERDDKNWAKLHRVNGLEGRNRFFTIRFSILEGGDA
jgi:putative DNA primase/helicase